jgi:tape measure domain-containing protein
MSKTVDERVVSMQFDNKHFERNVSTTMSTLDKLKQKLNLSGAAKGLDNVNAAAKKVDMTPLSNAVETVGIKFNAMNTIADQALRNITNSAMAAGKKIVSALTIDPVKTGFQEYETQINAVQTILANTESKGSTIDDVNKALEELNTYADKTIYNFTEMTRNIGTFTAAGVDLDTSVNAIQGIANLAAVSGSTSQQASTAMYQLSQALSSGTVKLMDWNSVVNAGMGGQVFQDALKETARVHGVAIDDMIKNEGSFRETLSKGWLTSEILTDTLQKFTMTTEGLNEEQIKANREMLRAKGYTDEQIDGIFKLGNTATNAATKVKTFTQLWDVMKESAQSGWAQTWKIIIGDFEEAKALFTPLSDFLTGFINKMSNARNRVLEIALDFTKPWTSIMDKLGNIKKVVKDVSKITDSLEYFQNVVNRVWRGDFNNQGDNPDRRDLLKAAGYDARVVQDLVNKGYRYKLTVEDIEASHKKFGLTMNGTTKETEKVANSVNNLTDEQFKNAGLTEDEIRLYRALEKEADRLGISVSELADEMSENNGRDMLIESFKNIGKAILGVGQAIKQAWVDIFNPPSTEEVGIRLYGIIRSIKDFTESLKLTDENADKLKRTFKGIFAIIDIILTVVGGPIKIAFKLLSQLLGVFNFNILDVTSVIGDAIVKFRDWLDSILDFTGVFEKLKPHILAATDAIKKWFNSIKDSKALAKFVEYIKSGAKAIKDWFGSLKDSKAFKVFVEYLKTGATYVKNWVKSLKDVNVLDRFVSMLEKARDSVLEWVNGLKNAENAPKYIADSLVNGFSKVLSVFKNLFSKIGDGVSAGFDKIPDHIISGLVNGIKDGASTVGQTLIELGNIILEKICDVLGIESPSKEFFEIGKYIIAGLINGIVEGATLLWDIVRNLGLKIVEIIQSLDLGSILTAGIGGGLVVGFVKFADAFEALTGPLDGIEDVLSGFGKMEKAVANNINAKALKNIAIAIAILAGAVVALAVVGPAKVWPAIGAVAALMVLVTGMATLVGKFGPKESVEFGKLGLALLGISASILLMAIAIKKLESLDFDKNAGSILGGLAVVLVSLIGILAAYGWLVKGKSAQNINKVGGMFIKIALSLMLLLLVIKIAAKLDESELIKGGLVILAFGGIITGLIAATKLAGNKIASVGSTILKIAAAMLLLTIVMKLASKMDKDELLRGGLVILAFGAIITGLIAATRLAGGKSKLNNIGSAIMGIAGALLITTVVVKLLAGMDESELIKGGVAILAFAGIITGLIAATKLAGTRLKNIGSTMIMISVAIAVLAGIAVLLGMVPTENLIKGTIVVAVLSGLMMGLIAVAKSAQNGMGVIISLTVALAIMATAMGVLSMIDTSKLIGATIALSVVMSMFALLIKISSKATSSIGPLITLTVAVGIMGAVLYLLAKTPVNSAMSSALALSVLMGVMSVIVVALSKIKVNVANALAGSLALTTMALPLLTLVGILYLMQHVENAAVNVKALVGLTAALTLLLIPLTIIGTFAMNALAGVLALTTMALPLATFIGVLYLMQHVENATENVAVLTTLMNALTIMLVKISLVAPLAVIASAAILALTGVIAVVGGLVVAIGALMNLIPQDTIEKWKTAFASFMDFIVILADGLGRAIGAFIGGVADGIIRILPALGTGLSDFWTNAKPFFDGVSGLGENTAIGVGVLVAAIAALTVASLINGIMDFLPCCDSFAELGSKLTDFWNASKPFFDGVKGLGEETINSVKNLASAILIITAANVVQGITSFISGETSLSSFGEQIGQLGPGIKKFSDSLTGIDDGAINKADIAANIIKTLAGAAKEIPGEGGWLQKICGEQNIESFGNKLASLGGMLTSFVNSLGDMGEDDVQKAGFAAEAIAKMTEATADIPAEGGWLQALVGSQDISAFASKLPGLGTNLGQFVNNLGVFGEEQANKAGFAAKAISNMANAVQNIPEGSWWEKLTGTDESAGSKLAAFCQELANAAPKLSSFSNDLGSFDGPKCIAAVQAVSEMAKAAATLDEAGLDGDEGILAAFVDELRGTGEKLNNFSWWISGCDTAKMLSVVRVLADVSNIAVTISSNGASNTLVGFAEEVRQSGEKLNNFSWWASGVDLTVVGSFTDSVTKLSSAASSVSSVNGSLVNFVEEVRQSGEKMNNFAWWVQSSDLSTVDSFIKAINKFGEISTDTISTSFRDAIDTILKIGEKLVDNFTKGIANKHDSITKAAKDMMDKFISGVESKETTIKKSLGDVMTACVNKIATYYSDFYDAGKYVVSGFSSGITDYTFKAEAKASAMAAAALEAAKEELDQNSPSKEFYKVGAFAGLGFVNALGDYASNAYDASSDMANSARKGLSDSVSKIAAMVDSDLDFQPTIRPVLDLSDVKSGVNSIGGMFGGRNALVVDTRGVGAISASMSRLQNGSKNSDVVSAIKALRKDMSDMPRNTYSINGITFDESSSVAEAIKTITRAVTIERRT